MHPSSVTNEVICLRLHRNWFDCSFQLQATQI